MLKTIDLINGVDKKYHEMLRMVNIPDFYKCIAQFSGLAINNVCDSVIKDYLITWAKNKYRFFEMLGNKLYNDIHISYENSEDNIKTLIKDLCKQFPGYALWLNQFNECTDNKINSFRDMFSWDSRQLAQELFPNFKGNTTITHFFKQYLQAPDELITGIAAMFENKIIEGTYTISIDPVDMMLASENPYNWNSCYRLEADGNDGSHADGCIAAVLDSSSLITYIWNNEGKLKIYDNYEFKSVRYKRMRQWIAIAPNMTAIHFNAIYPGKGKYKKEFHKQLRAIVEEKVCNFTQKENLWVKNENDSYVRRLYSYGYDEFEDSYIYHLKNAVKEDWRVYDEQVVCPCGCDNYLPGSYDCEQRYNGYGFTYENYEEEHWCEYCEEYCDCCDEESCYECEYWKNAHPVCDLDTELDCYEGDRLNVVDGIAECEPDVCRGCSRYQEHMQERGNEVFELIQDKYPNITIINDVNWAEQTRAYPFEGADEIFEYYIKDELDNLIEGGNQIIKLSEIML